MNIPKAGRDRRKSGGGSDHVKHRRTRSGCFTCRSRRVKCDEGRPTCERCRKGSRDCVYPEPSTLPKSGNKSKKAQARQESTGSSTEEYDDEEEDSNLQDVIEDGETSVESTSAPQARPMSVSRGAGTSKAANRQDSWSRFSSETPSLIQDKGLSPTPPSEGSTGYSAHVNVTAKNLSNIDSVLSKKEWSHLPQDVQYYLTYFYENITHHHYSLKHDSGDFLRTVFLDVALGNNALLYAVVGFSAFHQTLHNPEGRIQDFLKYYNKAVSMLLQSLQKGQRNTMGTLLTVLQLATIEESLGDWVNLLSHQKAAFEILTQLYTPQNIMQSYLTRTMFTWYGRFDVFAGLMAGAETVLSRTWFAEAHKDLARRVSNDPSNINWKLEEATASLKVAAVDMSILFYRLGKGEIATDVFMAENSIIGQKLSDWKHNMDPALQDSQWLVTDFSNTSLVDQDDIVDPYKPGILYHGPLWSMNILMLDWYAIDSYHKFQTALATHQKPDHELVKEALATCQLFEAVEYWPGSPNGSIIACQASLAIAALFLPRDQKHQMWCRRKFATVESNGISFPPTFRLKMSELYQDPSCMHWWLPNDESFPPIVRSIRNFVEERTSEARDLPSEDLRKIRGLFSSMNLSEDSTDTDAAQNMVPQSLTTAMDEQMWTGSGFDIDMISGEDLNQVNNRDIESKDSHKKWLGTTDASYNNVSET